MQIGILGVNYKSTSSLSLREDLIIGFLAVYRQFTNSVLISTCNRIEIFYSSDDLKGSECEIIKTLKLYVAQDIDSAVYRYFRGECFLHLAKVISGLDSAILGESDIQRQVKIAYEHASKEKSLSYVLHYLFQKGLKIGKYIRTVFSGEDKDQDLSQRIYSIIREYYCELYDLNILFIGDSRVNRHVIEYLKINQYNSVSLCTQQRRLDKHRTYPVFQWRSAMHLQNYDVIVCGTYYDGFMINTIDNLVHNILILDLSVPRIVNPEINACSMITLYNIDQLHSMSKHLIDQNRLKNYYNLITTATQKSMYNFHINRLNKWRLSIAT